MLSLYVCVCTPTALVPTGVREEETGSFRSGVTDDCEPPFFNYISFFFPIYLFIKAGCLCIALDVL